MIHRVVYAHFDDPMKRTSNLAFQQFGRGDVFVFSAQVASHSTRLVPLLELSALSWVDPSFTFAVFARRQRRSVTMSTADEGSVVLLQSWFPDIDTDVIVAVLDSNGTCRLSGDAAIVKYGE